MVSVIAPPFASTQQILSSSETASLEKREVYEQCISSTGGRFREMSFSQDSESTQNTVHTYIVNALETRGKGHGTPYEDLRRQFSCDPMSEGAPSSVQLKLLLLSLIHVASKLDSKHHDLIKDVLKTYWVKRDDEFVSVYIQFLGTIASAHSGYIPLIIQMLVQSITLDLDSEESFSEILITTNLIYDRIHLALKYILDLVPVSYTFLFSILVTEFPHKSYKTSHQVTYLKNLLRILEYAPVVSGQVLALIIDKIIQIDVEIQIELDDLDEEVDEVVGIMTNETGSNHQDKFSSFCEDDNINTENDDNDEPKDLSENQFYYQAIEHIRDMVNKLDCMLTALFDYLATIFTQSKESDCKSGSLMDITFEHLLHAFDSVILHTFRSRYTQFVLFWASQTNEKYINMFLGLVLERTLDISRSPVSRSISCAYVASFVARATHLSRDMARNTVNTLCRWMNLFLDDWENTDDSSNIFLKKFGTFYSVVQSILYIFCFRWRDLANDDPQEHSSPWLKSLFVLQRAIASRLNPLMVLSLYFSLIFSLIFPVLFFQYRFPVHRNRAPAWFRLLLPNG